MSQKSNMFVGMDVHKETIHIALAEEGGLREVRNYGVIGGDQDSVEKAIRKLRSTGKELHVVYEAGPCGFAIQRYLSKSGIDCSVVAPSLIPKKPGDQVKTDRRDAVSLARLHRAGELSPIYVPTAQDEAMRDLTRAREDAMLAYKRARQLLLSLLLRNGIHYTGKSHWSKTHLNWLSRINLPHAPQQIVFQEYLHSIEESHQRLERLTQQIETTVKQWRLFSHVSAFQSLRGVSLIVASGVVAELGDLSRFDHPKKVYSYVGLVPSEYSSGPHRRLGSITKSGNTHARRLLVEAGWSYQKSPKVSPIIRKRQKDLPKNICDIAWRAQLRLSTLYKRMLAKGKNSKLAVTAVARELVGYMWEISKEVKILN